MKQSISEKNRECELSFGCKGTIGSIKLKNINNRVIATIGDILIDSLSYFRWNNAIKFLDKYNLKKQERNLIGKETPLPTKFIIEILNNAFQEDNIELQDNWNNILVNWQDLERNCDKKYMYLDILKNLGLNEVKFLKMIIRDPKFKLNCKNEDYYYDSKLIRESLELTADEYELMILNLFRLKVCDSYKPNEDIIYVDDVPVRADAGIYKVRITLIGYNLIKNILE